MSSAKTSGPFCQLLWGVTVVFPGPAERYDPSNMSWVYARVSSPLGMPKIPAKGGVQEAPSPNAQTILSSYSIIGRSSFLFFSL